VARETALETERQFEPAEGPEAAQPDQVTEVVDRNSVVSVSAASEDVLVAGPWFADLIFRGLSRPILPGTEVFADEFTLLPGGAFSLAMALHRLGHDVVWATDFGDDLFSQHVLSIARAEGLNEVGFRHHPIPLRSLTVVLSYPHDRAMATYQDRIRPPSLATLLREHHPRTLLLPSLQYGHATRAALCLAHELGIQVFMDCQDVPGTLDTPTMRDTLAQVDIFAPNTDEALRLTGTTTVEDALDALADLMDTVIIKRGRAGATAVQRGQRYDVAGIPLAVVDTTGAGDCFNAGFIHAQLAGDDLPDCLAAGVACGAAAITDLGSNAAPNLVQLQQWLSRVPHR
jgi:sugar/nucleoside kinase (ribokinase family)